MTQTQADRNTRPPPDAEIVRIAEYVHEFQPPPQALDAAELCLADSIGCALMALSHEACARHLGPLVPGAEMPDGAGVIGCAHRLDPVKAAFDNGMLIRWLDFNDTWLAAEWGHPSDNLGGIWAVADYLSRRGGGDSPSVQTVLEMMVKAHEIQGVLALENSFNRRGLDHVALVKIASAAVCAKLLGANRAQTISALSHAFADGQSLRVYRHAPNTGRRKSWAAGDASSRGVRLALMACAGEEAIPGALTAPVWGFYDVSFGGKPFSMAREYGSYVMENILFKVSFPAEFHAQTAVECAVLLHPQAAPRLDEITRVKIETQESAVRIISKTGPLHNPADRDHCLQYMAAAGLIFGELAAAHYEDNIAADPRIDILREKMEVAELPQYSRDYLDPDKRSIANAVQIFFADGTQSDRTEIEYPLGHKRRRAESIPALRAKFNAAAKAAFSEERCAAIGGVFADSARLRGMPMRGFAELFAAEQCR
ncbi:MAG: bifunctional 2-methylcitrate dehydratase/aconitate hydratase [Gammaproteobacteria bacterium]